jgi:DNA-binding FadR family transcriptional regulator
MENLLKSVSPRGRLADYVGEQLEKLILEGHLEPGTKLPTETELCQQFNVSRTVVREAVNSLVAKGLVETRQGVGTTVLPVSRDTIVSSLNRFLHVRNGGVSFEDLHLVRIILELATAQLAASRATEEDLVHLRQMVREMPLLEDDTEAFASKDADFHRALALATHNQLLVVLSDTIRDLLKEYVSAVLPHLDMATDVHPYHRRIVERVEAKDRKGARQAMREHLTQAPWEQFHEQDLLE